MRNAYDCCDSEPIIGRIIYGEKFPFGAVSEEICTCCDGEPVVGRIIYGEKYPFGTVSKETYEAGMETVNTEIGNIRNAVNTLGERELLAETKIEALTASSAQQNVRMNQLTDSINSLTNDIAAIREEITAAKARIKAVEDVAAIFSKCFEYEE